MWIKIAQLLLSLSLLVIVHEFGHFMFAKWFGCRVERFYLFFNPWFSLFKFKKGETEYGIGWIPFGGYVTISGMIDESMNTDQMKEAPKPWEFRTKPAWQRLLVMAGGVMMNLVLAAFIYIGISYVWGDAYVATKDAKYGFVASPLAQEMGFRNGDKILNVDGLEVEDSKDVTLQMILDQAGYVEVERAGQTVRIPITPDFIPRILNEKTFLTLRLPVIVANMVDGSPARAAGMAVGDTVLSVAGREVASVEQLPVVMSEVSGDTLAMVVARTVDGVRTEVTLPVAYTKGSPIGIEYSVGVADILTISTREYNLLQAIPAGFKRAGTEIGNYLKQLKLIFTPKTEAYKSVGGFIAIGNIFPDTWSWYAFWNITALLSVMLAIVNLLPIPALDGGHVLFQLYEIVTRRKPSDKFLERAQIIGMFLLLFLILYANGNDVLKLFSK